MGTGTAHNYGPPTIDGVLLDITIYVGCFLCSFFSHSHIPSSTQTWLAGKSIAFLDDLLIETPIETWDFPAIATFDETEGYSE